MVAKREKERDDKNKKKKNKNYQKIREAKKIEKKVVLVLGRLDPTAFLKGP